MAKRRVMSENDLILAKSMLDLGDGPDKVAEHFGVSRTTLWRYLGKTSDRAVRAVDENTKYFIYQSMLKGLSVAEIAAKYSLGRSTIYRILDQYQTPQESENVDPVEPATEPSPRRHTRVYRPRR